AIQIESKRTGERAHRPAELQLRSGTEAARQLEPRRFGLDRRESVHADHRRLQVDRERRRYLLGGGTDAAAIAGELRDGSGDGLAGCLRIRRGTRPRWTGHGLAPRREEGAEGELALGVALDEDPGLREGHAVDDNALGPVDIDTRRGRAVDAHHRTLAVAHVDVRER